MPHARSLLQCLVALQLKDIVKMWPSRLAGIRPEVTTLAPHYRLPFRLRVIVTPAVYPRLVEFLHFDIQSTGQKSHCVTTFSGLHNALF